VIMLAISVPTGSATASSSVSATFWLSKM
jgi:hypothetical protein